MTRRRDYPAARRRPLTAEETATVAADYQARARAAQALTRHRMDPALGLTTPRLRALPGEGPWVLELLLDESEWVSANDRRHHHQLARARRKVRHLAAGMALALDVRAVAALAVRVEVGYPSRRRADPENSQPVVKAAIDGLVDAGVVADDDHEHLIHAGFRRAPELAPPGRHLVRLHLTPVLPDDLTLED